ncbi:MAG: cytochrome c peroxidase, partial [Desulfobacterales bacterium]|nr:cytochrome c peroxidase [Desulfobacterales bacterium]
SPEGETVTCWTPSRGIWQLVFWFLGVLVVSGPFPAVAQAQPPNTAGDRVESQQRRAVSIINRGGCASCHVIPGVPGADGTVGPDLSQLGTTAGRRRPGVSATDYIRESIVSPDAFVAPVSADGEEYSEGVMPAQFARTLSEADLDILVAYLATLGVSDRSTPDPVRQRRLTISIERPPESVLKPFAPLSGAVPSDAQLVFGKLLFFDRRLSNNNSLSCASCHQPDLAFADGEPMSAGYPSLKLFRNTPTLLNVAYARTLYWDGRMTGSDLSSVVRDHLTESHFMAADGRLLVERMKQVPEYVELFDKAFGAVPSFGKILDAVAAYVRSLNSPPAPFDRFQAGDATAISTGAQAGWMLFQGRAGCVRCHSGPRFTDDDFHRLDGPDVPGWRADPERMVAFRRFFRVLGTPEYRGLQDDPGRFVINFREADRQRFRTPTLREVDRTAPYLHNGSLATLEDVVAFYNAGGGRGQTAGLAQLNLSASEQSQLVEFLKTLSSPAIPVTPPELPDYATLPPGGGLQPAGDPRRMVEQPLRT